MMRRFAFSALILVPVLALAGCGSGGDSAAGDKAGDEATNDVGSVLVLNGKNAEAEPLPEAPEAKAKAAAKRKVRIATTERVWPAPELLADGTIDDGPDPFEGERVQVQPIPIEDDPATTAAVDATALRMRRIDRAEWDRWMAANGNRSPWQQGNDTFADSIVDVTVERCGGARTVATGVVIADELVVTTVHAVESASKRVRIAPTIGSSARIPAMVRFLDIDDDIAVLKVPGLTTRPMPVYVPTSAAPSFGYAYGISQGGLAGTLRRTPVVVSMTESSIQLEQPDGFAQEISDRSVQTLVGGISTGFSGGVVAATNDPDLATGWGFHGMIRARVPFRADTGGIVVPSRLIRDAVTASGNLDQWFEHRPGGCPQWRR